MRTFFILCVTAFVAAAIGSLDEWTEDLNKNHGECMSETDMDEALLNKSRDFDEGNFSVKDEPLKRYVFCMMRKKDLITEDGHFNKDVAMTKLPMAANREKVEKAIDACKDVHGDTPHETAWLIVKCFKEKYSDHTVM